MYDGTTGVGQQMSALGVIHSAMVQIPGEKLVAPVTNSTGGTSLGDASAGTMTPGLNMPVTQIVVTTGDKLAASFLTVAMVGGVIGGSAFAILGS